MNLTLAQKAIIKADIGASLDADVIAARTIGNHTELARLYNLPSTKVVWKSQVDVIEYRAVMVWSEVDSLTVGQARIWEWLTGSMTLPIQASSAFVRQGIADCFANGTATRTNLITIAKRAASRTEALFASGTGTDVSPATLVYEGQIDIDVVGKIMNGG